jgi:hypothetical protein
MSNIEQGMSNVEGKEQRSRGATHVPWTLDIPCSMFDIDVVRLGLGLSTVKEDGFARPILTGALAGCASRHAAPAEIKS